MKDCIGAIDGTHVPISISPRLQDPYRNRKGTLSQNVMVACNFDNQFVHVSAGWEGSASDARVLQDALETISMCQRENFIWLMQDMQIHLFLLHPTEMSGTNQFFC